MAGVGKPRLPPDTPFRSGGAAGQGNRQAGKAVNRGLQASMRGQVHWVQRSFGTGCSKPKLCCTQQATCYCRASMFGCIAGHKRPASVGPWGWQRPKLIGIYFLEIYTIVRYTIMRCHLA